MKIEKLIEVVRLCGSTPKVDQCKQCAYWSGGDMSKCIPRMTTDAATALSTALRRMQPLTLTRTLADVELSVEVRPAHPAWHVAMVVQVRAKKGRVEWVQTFESVEEAVKSIEQDKGPVVGIHKANLVSLPKVHAV